MSRKAKGRSSYLTADEIAKAALRQFDTSPQALSMRALAAALGVSPASIYHHFPNEEAVIRAAMALVFEEAVNDFLAGGPQPPSWTFEPIDFLVRSAVCLRRAFLHHYRIARNIGMSPDPSERMSDAIAVYGQAFERLGLSGERAAEALFAWGHFVYGSILISSSALVSAERWHETRRPFSSEATRGVNAPEISDTTSKSLDAVLSSTFAATDHEERLFITAVQRLVDAYVTADADHVAPRDTLV